jgi:hypothetical protein
MIQSKQSLQNKRKVLLKRLAQLSSLVHGSYLERFSTCIRKNCACHQGKKHGPRSYVVLYDGKRQRQVYVPQSQRQAIRQGIRQHEKLLATVKEITAVNIRLMRMGELAARKKGTNHE